MKVGGKGWLMCSVFNFTFPCMGKNVPLCFWTQQHVLLKMLAVMDDLFFPSSASHILFSSASVQRRDKGGKNGKLKDGNEGL